VGTAGSPVSLTGAKATPDNANNQTIVWSVKDAGDTGVTTASIANGAFTPSAAGTLVLTATIANGKAQGENFVKDFTITVSAANAFVAVTNITSVPTAGTVGTAVSLAGAKVEPDNATNKAIVWSVKTAEGGSINGNTFTPAKTGAVTLTATIANGKAQGEDYSKDFEIVIAEEERFVAVTNITGVPNQGTAGIPVSLTGAQVVPNNATNRTISWVVKTSGAGVTAITGNSFTPTSAGNLVLTARILSGAAANTPYLQDFTFTIAPAFVAVSGINGLPGTKNAVTGTELDLTADISVQPPEATNKNIVWSVKTAGDTGLTNAIVETGVFTPTSAGTATLTATIPNGRAQGSDYAQDIIITIIKPVTGISGVPSSGTKGYAVSLAGAQAEPQDATNRTIVWSVKTAGAGVTAITGTSFTPTGTGTLTLTATIVNGSAAGTDFSRDYTITINDPGETEIDFGLVDDTSILLSGNLSGTSQGQLSRDTPIQIAKNAVYYVSLITSGGSYSDIVWYLNGTKQTIGGSGNLIYLNTATPGTVKLAVIAKRGGQFEGSGMYTFVIGN
jgi:endo-1,4-beta-xylanase